MKNVVALLAVVFSLASSGSPAGASEDSPYLYHPGETLGRGAAVLESETAIGTRESRPFGEEGVEQGVRVRYGALTPLTLEAWGATLFNGSGLDHAAWAVESRLRLLDQGQAPMSLQLGAGWLQDFQGVSVPRLRLTGSRSLDGLDLRATSLAEIPTGVAGRDAVDLIIGVAGSTAMASHLRLGAEILGEDLEGLWDEEEAEGGAKLLAGPTVDSALSPRLALKLNASAYYPVTRNTPTRVQPGIDASSGPGFLGRLAVSYAF
ncbi:MAG: hypothetical protein HYT87_13725 [Nitrospirae bacterium]|nr:hypothetical protein [Nitrospirota bacterium]